MTAESDCKTRKPLLPIRGQDCVDANTPRVVELLPAVEIKDAFPNDARVLASLTEPFTVEDWLIDPRAGTVAGPDGAVRIIGRRPLEVLQVLAAAEGRTISRRSLLRAIWAGGASDSTLTRTICRLRRELGANGAPSRIIETVPGVGYRLAAPVVRDVVPDSFGKTGPLQSLMAELKRRRVVRVATAYAVSAWLVAQVGEVLFPPLGLPDWCMTFLVLSLIFGFPLVVILTWVLQITERGLELDKPMATHPGTTRMRLLVCVVSTMLVIGVALLGYQLAAGDDTECGPFVASFPVHVAK